MHVLSTPPAFVLSQDQTLHRDLGGRGPPSIRRAGLEGHYPVGRLAPETDVVRSQCIDFATIHMVARTGFWLSSVPFSRSMLAERTRHPKATEVRVSAVGRGPRRGSDVLPRRSVLLDGPGCRKTASWAAAHCSTSERAVKPLDSPRSRADHLVQRTGQEHHVRSPAILHPPSAPIRRSGCTRRGPSGR